MPKSHIGQVLEKISDSQNVTSSGRGGGTIRRRHLEYEDGVIARSVEAREQIKRMSQPFTFSREEMDARQLIYEQDNNAIMHSLIKGLRNKITLRKPGLASSVLVTSIGNAKQSSVLARNLASAIAADETRTSLLLELWNTGSILYGSDPIESGLAEFIEKDEIQVSDILVPTGVRRMRVIPFGGSDYLNTEFMRTTRLRILIKDVTRRFPRDRFTIFDAPPIDQVADVELLNEYADLILVCIPYGEVSPAQIKKGLAKLDSKKLLGTILCGAPRTKKLSTKLAK